MNRVFHFHAPLRKTSPVPGAEAVTSGKPGGRRGLRLALGACALTLVVCILLIGLARAGGPQYVAGVNSFDDGLAGQPLTWAAGAVNYYTDQGDLSPLLRGPDADSFVAGAFARWTSISSAAVSATRAGQLAEDVSGTNVVLNLDRTVTMPADVLAGSGKPVAIVYDADGAVTDALLGTGASTECFGNAVFGGPDAFTSDAHIAHAIVVLDGLCAATSSDLSELQYRLVRVLGRVFGLSWSQLNLNVITGAPYPTLEEKNGFPLMHAEDPISCVPISLCYPNADQPKMDDRSSLSRLYPITSANAAQFPGKQLFGANTARIRGTVRFTDRSGNPTQPMQGVNVVARWIDPVTHIPSGRYAASSVSGFLHRGNAGNPITGYDDAFGEPYSRFGSNDEALKGFFDLAGLELPVGSGGQYQISIEAVDPMWSQSVGPYAPWQVRPSGTAQPIIVIVNKGDDIQRDILMIGSATDTDDSGGNEDSYESPAPLPPSGDWMGELSGYGDVDYFLLNGQANRTLAIELTALDENDQPTEQKAQPVIGMWSMSAPEGTPPPAFTSSSFNVGKVGVTRLNAQLLSPTQFRIGIADMRGDGRPDFRYRAHLLYGDAVTPSRTPAHGGTSITLQGMGFKPNMTVAVGGQNATLLAASANRITAAAPPLTDGEQSVTITDSDNGSSTTLQNALTYGAGPNDVIRLTQGTNPQTAVGGEAPSAIRVLVTTPDGVTPVSGATVQWSTTNGATLAACNGTASCTAFTDESGKAETRVRVGAVGAAYVTAMLAPASYSPAKQVQAPVSGTSSAKDISILSPKVWVAQGATVDLPLTARLLANGIPLVGQTLNFMVGIGSGSPSPASAATDSSGYARSALHLNAISGDVQGTICLAPGNNPCQTFYVLAVAPSALRLEKVAGSNQAIPAGQSFQPIWARVTDSAAPANPVAGASVVFSTKLFAPYAGAPVESNGESTVSQHPQRIILGSSQGAALSDPYGLVSVTPNTGGLNRPLDVEVEASAGSGAVLDFQLKALPRFGQAIPGLSNGSPRRGSTVVQHRQPSGMGAEGSDCVGSDCQTWPMEKSATPEAERSWISVGSVFWPASGETICKCDSSSPGDNLLAENGHCRDKPKACPDRQPR